MQIVIGSSGGYRELNIALRNPEATLGDLVVAAGARCGSSVLVNGRSVPASCPVTSSGLHDGAVLDVGGGAGLPDAGRRTRPAPHLAVVAGPAAGMSFPLALGRSSIGRHPSNTVTLNHPTVSRRHCEIELDAAGSARVVDAGAANPTVVDGYRVRKADPVVLAPRSVVEVGALALAVRVPEGDDRPRGGDLSGQVGQNGTIAFNRPPRVAPAPPPGPVTVPAEPETAHKPDFSLTMVGGPLVLAVGMIAVTGNVQFALFALLSPIVAVGMWYEGKRRAAKKDAAEQARYSAELKQLHQQVVSANATELDRRWLRSPDPAEALRRASAPSVRLWERRPHHGDYLTSFLGIGNLPWRPGQASGSSTLPERIAERVEASTLRSAPVVAELARGGVVGVVGSRADAVALARSITCQAAVHQGPADLTIGVFVDTGRTGEWEWAKWLPHTRDSGGTGARWIGEGRDQCDALLKELGRGGSRTVLLVIDSDTMTDGVDAPARTLLHNHPPPGPQSAQHTPRFSGVVVASSADRLPAMCSTIVDVTPDGTATVWYPDERRDVRDVLTSGLGRDGALVCARDLARFEDPELHTPGGQLPDLVRLLPLLGLPSVDAGSIRAKWRSNGPLAHPVAPLGVTEKGVFALDLVDHGPHGLVGGTTGSGKSELLRSLVAGLAAGSDPRSLTFVLIDYKGGAAFDECARLPHTVGMVTDLDAALSERALTALNAELHHRERVLRAAGADNIVEYRKLGAAEPMPRLVVVVDEFATLAKELPEFMKSLVGIAQRGRSLGVHMILATQRPSGAVNDDIRANTGLKIALRVQDAADSLDVIGARDAADINRMLRGRAFARLGPGELLPIQTALITCVTEASTDIAVEVSPFEFAPTQRQAPQPVVAAPGPDGRAAERTDLVRLVDAIVAANALEGIAPPRRPWPEPLPNEVPLTDLVGASTGGGEPVAVVALADDPAAQRQYPMGWEVARGNLALVGITGSGTTTTLAALALALASVCGPDELELQAFDFGSGELAALERLPQTGAVVAAGDRERQMRLMRYVVGELGRRRQVGPGAAGRRLVVLVDNIAALRAQFTDHDGAELFDRFARVVADGPGVGISFVASADKTTAFSGALAMPQQWLFRLTDPYDYVGAGVARTNVPAAVAGRAVIAAGGMHVQVGRPLPDLAAVVESVAGAWPDAVRVADAIGVLPAEVAAAAVREAVVLKGDRWSVPVGIDEQDLLPACVHLYEGEHALVTGPSRSGKSTVLWTVAEALRHGGGPALHMVGMGGRRSPLRDCPAFDSFASTPGEAAPLLARLRTVRGPAVLVVDDAETFDDGDSAIAELVRADLPNLHVIAAGQNDALRKLYQHWTKLVARSRSGLLLRPNLDMDGELLGAMLPRRAPVSLGVPGRGYLVVNGEARIVQAAKA